MQFIYYILVYYEKILFFHVDKEDCPDCETVLNHLEQIDTDADKSGIALVKVSDKPLALEFGLESLPALLYYRNKVPLLYDGKFSFFNALLLFPFLKKCN